MGYSDKKRECVDSIRLSQQEQEEVLTALDSQTESPGVAELRCDERISYRKPGGVVVTLAHPGGTVAHFIVRPRNLSRFGIGFLHGGFLHEGSSCRHGSEP